MCDASKAGSTVAASLGETAMPTKSKGTGVFLPPGLLNATDTGDLLCRSGSGSKTLRRRGKKSCCGHAQFPLLDATTASHGGPLHTGGSTPSKSLQVFGVAESSLVPAHTHTTSVWHTSMVHRQCGSVAEPRAQDKLGCAPLPGATFSGQPAWTASVDLDHCAWMNMATSISVPDRYPSDTSDLSFASSVTCDFSSLNLVACETSCQMAHAEMMPMEKASSCHDSHMLPCSSMLTGFLPQVTEAVQAPPWNGLSEACTSIVRQPLPLLHSGTAPGNVAAATCMPHAPGPQLVMNSPFHDLAGTSCTLPTSQVDLPVNALSDSCSMPPLLLPPIGDQWCGMAQLSLQQQNEAAGFEPNLLLLGAFSGRLSNTIVPPNMATQNAALARSMRTHQKLQQLLTLKQWEHDLEADLLHLLP
jgi:hypothetical protein